MSTAAMVEPDWPLKCAGVGCKAQVCEENAHSVWQCTKAQGHTHALCSLECQRSFEKSCRKVADKLDKRKEELNQSKGHALHKANQTEQEKLKQREKAERTGGLLCPTDAKPDGRVATTQVPHCSWCLQLVSGPAVPEAPLCAEVPSASSACPAEAPPQVLLTGLEDFDMLVEYKKGEDEDFGGRKKKGVAPKKAKDRRLCLSVPEVTQRRQSEDLPEAPTPTTTDELDEPGRDEQAPSSSSSDAGVVRQAEAAPGSEEGCCEPDPEDDEWVGAPRLYASTRDWRPKPSPELAQCLTVLEGQILEVTWVQMGQDHKDAWAYGRIRGQFVDGYFPEEILGPVPRGFA